MLNRTAMDKPEKELAIDLAEMGVDSLLNEGLLKDIPIVSSLVSLIRLAKSIPDRIFAAKVRAFLSRIENVDALKKKQFLADVSVDSAKRAKISEVLVLALDHMDDLGKSEYMAYSFMAYIEGIIDAEMFRRFLHSIVNAFTPDLAEFVSLTDTKGKTQFSLPYHLRGLTSGAFVRDSGGMFQQPRAFIPCVTDVGIKFCEVVAIYRRRCT
jgi:hypothetical protein